ncbi:MAG: DUF2070 family protein [Candidatus Micrarchaeales archaeon]|nr:DUF2070 family protein [Candidatus Micrarchaeales archaeon]
MSEKSGDPINKLSVFSKNMPSTPMLLFVLFIISAGTGIGSIAIIFTHESIVVIIAEGILTGILTVFLPTLLTVATIKSLKKFVKMRYLIFVAMLGAMAYCIAIFIASAVYAITNNFSLANAIVLVGDASIFAWWFFVSKVMLALKKKAIAYAIIQPLFNMLIYVAAGWYIFTFSEPLSLLLVKLSAGIFVFLIISYMLLFVFDSPIKRSLGFGGIDVFSEVVQNWLFDVDLTVSSSFAGSFGTPYDIDTHTLVFRNRNNEIKSIFFVPWIHYGPVGTLGGSSFPYLLERYVQSKYKTHSMIMHSAVNEDNNPLSSSQVVPLKKAIERAVANGKRITGENTRISFVKRSHNGANVSILSINNVSLVTFTRAPNVTEDISAGARRVFKELLESGGSEAILIDAHNCRYESAPKEELDGVTSGSRFLNDYISAIKSRREKPETAKKLEIGVASVDIYNELHRPKDLAIGNMNVAIFRFNRSQRAIIQFNSNNMLPTFRESVIAHVRQHYGIEAELYTSDTHAVNSIRDDQSNVLGRHTSAAAVIPFIDRAIDSALADVEHVDAYYGKETIKRFMIWGPGVRERAFATINSVMSMAKVLVPTIIAAGFIIASWLIFLV